MKSPARATLWLVSATLLALHCVHCAPNTDLSGKSDRVKRYIEIRDESQNDVKQVEATTQARQNTDYGNNEGNYVAGSNYNGGNNYNNGNNNYSNGVNAPNHGEHFNKPELVPEEPQVPVLNETNDGNSHNNGIAIPTQKPPQQVGFAAVVNSFWNMVLHLIRGAMGIQRRDPPRIARVLIRAAVTGKDACWKSSACHAGRMMRGLPNSDILFMVAERFTAGDYKKVVRRVRRAAEDNENCSLYECDA